ncbi:3'-5' exonuclease [Oscillospiraceae bacterium HV4-5-C5C]|nr:3'-5' exonuclease [Oscillospiraceae bacterium HV4-5-C5C]
MKVGLRKPNYKSSLKARTSGRIKRDVNRAVKPLYGKKGLGYIKDPERTIKNRIYQETTVRTPWGISHSGSGTKHTMSGRATSQLSGTTDVPPDHYRRTEHSQISHSRVKLKLGISFCILALICLVGSPGGSIVFATLGIILIIVSIRSMKPSQLLTQQPARQEQKVRQQSDSVLAGIPSYPISLGAAGSLHRQNLEDMPAIQPRYKLLKGDKKAFIVIDVETTGLKPQFGRICQLSAIKFACTDDGQFQPIEQFNTYINPHFNIPEQASNVNGLTNAMLASAPTISQVYQSFMDFVGQYALIGYNISFDLKFLWCSGFDLVKGRRHYDVLGLVKRSELDTSDNKLQTVAEALGIYCRNHDSLNDCYATGMVMQKLLAMLS